MKGTIRWRNLLRFAAAYNAVYMGAAFISGQETLQFYMAFGWWGFAGMALVVGLFIFEAFRFQDKIFRDKIAEPFEAVHALCGKRMGLVFTWMVLLALVLGMVSMMAGSGAVAAENYGLPGFAGRAFVAAAAVAVVLLGLDRIVDVLGVVGPLNIALMVVVAVMAVWKMPLSVSEGMTLAPELIAVKGGATWWFSAIKYAGYGLLVLIPVYMISGSQASSLREAKLSAFTQMIPLVAVWILVMCAQAGNITEVAGTEIPNVTLARLYAPALSKVFGISILLGTFSATTMSLWSLVRKLAEEGTRKYRLLTLAIGAAALVISGLLPFSKILNLSFTIVFSIGMILFGILVWGVLRRRQNEGKDEQQ